MWHLYLIQFVKTSNLINNKKFKLVFHENVSGNIKAGKWIQLFQIKIQTKFSHLDTLPAKMIKISLMV